MWWNIQKMVGRNESKKNKLVPYKEDMKDVEHISERRSKRYSLSRLTLPV
jgi:hypothetical protein